MWLSVMLTLASGCASNTAVTRDFCVLYEPVYHTLQDEQRCGRLVDDGTTNNITYETLCR